MIGHALVAAGRRRVSTSGQPLSGGGRRAEASTHATGATADTRRPACKLVRVGGGGKAQGQEKRARPGDQERRNGGDGSLVSRRLTSCREPIRPRAGSCVLHAQETSQRKARIRERAGQRWNPSTWKHATSPGLTKSVAPRCCELSPRRCRLSTVESGCVVLWGEKRESEDVQV